MVSITVTVTHPCRASRSRSVRLAPMLYALAMAFFLSHAALAAAGGADPEITSHAPSRPEIAPLINQSHWITFFCVLTLFAAGSLVGYQWWLRRSAEGESDNPFRPISLTPIRRGFRSSETSRTAKPQSLHQVIGSAPKSAPPAAAAPPSAEQFIYAAAHDLQEPLRKIRAFADRLETKFKTASVEGVGSDIDSIRHTLGRMQGMLDSLLSLARIQGRGAVFETVDLGKILRDVITDLETRISETQGQISITGTPPELAGDAVQLQQLLQNLIGNALKFHRTDVPPRVQICVNVVEDLPVNAHNTDRSWCEITIQDNGIGFEEVHWERLLRGFHRLQGRDQYPGTGLGLSICRSIVDRHQGSISARSVPNEGSTFLVRLPMRQYARSGDTTILAGPSVRDGVARFWPKQSTTSPKHY